MQIFSHLVQGNILEFKVEMEGVGKMCVFQQKTGHNLETMRDTTLDDLEGQYVLLWLNGAR